MKRIIAVVAVLTWAGVLLVIGGDAADGNPGPVCGNPDAGDCFTANGTPGCGDVACCELVCAPDGFAYCCEIAWDGVCAKRALEYCSLCECTLDSELAMGETASTGRVPRFPRAGAVNAMAPTSSVRN